jgi:hypothetical protein
MGTDIDSGDTNAIEAFDLLLASWILLGTTADKFFIDVVGALTLGSASSR